MRTSYSLLLNGQYHPDHSGTVPVSGQAILLPRIQAARSAKEVVWSILVEQVTGAPTTASLYAGFQGGFRTSKGDENPPAGVGGGAGASAFYFTDVAQQWFTLNGDTEAGFLPDGDLPNPLADQTVSTATLAAAIAVGDNTVTITGQQFQPGTTLNIGNEAFYVVGPATISGSNWVHPVVSGGSPSGTSDTADSTNILKGWACKAHTNGSAVNVPVRTWRRVLGGFDQRLLLVPTFSGGTTPAFIVTVDVRARG